VGLTKSGIEHVILAGCDAAIAYLAQWFPSTSWFLRATVREVIVIYVLRGEGHDVQWRAEFAVAESVYLLCYHTNGAGVPLEGDTRVGCTLSAITSTRTCRPTRDACAH
jgi:hypothetical protein